MYTRPSKRRNPFQKLIQFLRNEFADPQPSEREVYDIGQRPNHELRFQTQYETQPVWPNPLLELSQALRQATPSVDEHLLPKSLDARAEQIAKELEEDLPALTEDDTQLLQRLDQLVSASKSRIDSGKEALSHLANASQSMESDERRLASIFGRIASDISSDLQDFNQTLQELNTLQKQHQSQREKRIEILQTLIDQSKSEVISEETSEAKFEVITSRISSDLKYFDQFLQELNTLENQRRIQEGGRNEILIASLNDLQRQFDSYGDAFNKAITNRPQKPHQKKPSASAIANEARFLAEAQARRDLLNQQRHHQLNQSRIVFFVALTLLSLGVLLVFAGISAVYFFSHLTAGTITAAVGSIVNISSALVFRFNKQENDRLDAITRELSILDRVTMAMQYINQISDAEKKDQAILDLTKQLYTF